MGKEEQKHREELGARIKSWREYTGYSQEDLAKYLNIPRSGVSQIEQGNRKIDSNELQKLSKLFQCSMDDLVGQETDAPDTLSLVAREAAGLSEEDKSEILRFAKFLQSKARDDTK